MRRTLPVAALFLGVAALTSAGCQAPEQQPAQQPAQDAAAPDMSSKYASFTLTTDMGALSGKEREMIPLLIDAAKEMDALFWMQAYGDKEALLASTQDPELRRYLEINYGPWDRLDDNKPFMEGVGDKPAGANLYPTDMTREEFDAACSASDETAKRLKDLYTIVRRDDQGGLEAVPYSTAFADGLARAADKLRAAAALAEDPGLKRYLELRAEALVTDDYRDSDFAWMDMKDNGIDIVIGPIETYEDQLYGYKASFEAYVLVKDKEWSRKLARYIAMLPDLQKGLPVPDEYKKETPGTGSDLNAYDALYYAGDCNAGAKTIAINLPNDEEVQLSKGTRRLQLKNAMRAKFDKIMVPIADRLIAEDQRKHVTFDAFFANTMFHEVAHGLGIKNTIDGKGTVREALKDRAGALEEGKADVLGLYMITQLVKNKELGDADVRDNYVTFMAGIFRSVRFGAADAHGRANMARFNFFKQMGAFSRDETTGTYRVDFDRMEAAMNALSEKILTFQGNGDYAGVGAFMDEMGVIGPELQAGLDSLSSAGIPVDIVFEQGMQVLN